MLKDDSIEQSLSELEEILTFRIIVTKVVSLDDNDKLPVNDDKGEAPIHKQDVYFTGYCECELYTGTIMNGVDHQAYQGDKCLQMLAEYEFQGVDAEGTYCEMIVCNRMKDGKWKPKIKVDSKAIGWLNEADLTAVVEGGPLGPTIRVYK